MSIGSRIKQRREELGYTQPQLAKLIGVSKGTIGNYESNISSPNEDILFKLFEILKCDANFLYQDNIDWEDFDLFSPSEKDMIKKYRTLDEYGKKAVDSILDIEISRIESANSKPIFTFRKFSENKVSAGAGFDLNDPDQWKAIEVIDTPEARQADFAVEVEGSSMEPDYFDGDIVYIALASEVAIGQVGLFIQNGKGYIKEAGENCLISRNPKYDDIFPSDGSIECKGKVIGVAELAE